MVQRAVVAVLPGPAAGRESLYLASASPARAALLRRAGVIFTQEPAAVDEEEIKAGLRAEGAPERRAAETLAELKARKVSERHPQALVIGADQMLVCGDTWFDKPADADHARAHLQALRGREHLLVSAVCVAKGGERIWHHIDTAEMEMRPFSDAFIDQYLAAAGDTALASVGAYRLEGLGAQLFARVRGDHFTVLGLPLLPLLDFLREHDMVPA